MHTLSIYQNNLFRIRICVFYVLLPSMVDNNNCSIGSGTIYQKKKEKRKRNLFKYSPFGNLCFRNDFDMVICIHSLVILSRITRGMTTEKPLSKMLQHADVVCFVVLDFYFVCIFSVCLRCYLVLANHIQM